MCCDIIINHDIFFLICVYIVQSTFATINFDNFFFCTRAHMRGIMKCILMIVKLSTCQTHPNFVLN